MDAKEKIKSRFENENSLKCFLCNSLGNVWYDKIPDRLYKVPGEWNFICCEKCKILWLHPKPNINEIPYLYSDEYFTHKSIGKIHLGSTEFKKRIRLSALSKYYGYQHLDPKSPFFSIIATILMTIPFSRKRITMGFGKMLIPYIKGGSILDIGCGNGTYLAYMKEMGWKVAGIEMDQKAAEIAQSKFGIPVYVGKLEDAPFDKYSFDVITLIHVIEHTFDPISFLIESAYFLKPNGYLIIITPNLNSLGNKFFGKNWYYLDTPRHFYIFSPKSLRMCLQQTNAFNNIKISTSHRTSRKIFRKYWLVKETGLFINDNENLFLNKGKMKILSYLFDWSEASGNFIFKWGEEIECIAQKK